MNALKKTLAGVAAAGTAIAGAVVASGGQETKPAQEPQTMPEMFAQLQVDPRDQRRCRYRERQLDECHVEITYPDCEVEVVNTCDDDEDEPESDDDSGGSGEDEGDYCEENPNDPDCQ